MADPSFDDLKALSEARFGDAESLLAANRFSAAYYLAGYAIECGLKAVISLAFRQHVIPSRKFVADIHTHDLTALVALAGLKIELDRARAANPQLDANWAFVSGWKETARYETIDPFLARRMLIAIGDPDAGVLSWLKAHW